MVRSYRKGALVPRDSESKGVQKEHVRILKTVDGIRPVLINRGIDHEVRPVKAFVPKVQEVAPSPVPGFSLRPLSPERRREITLEESYNKYLVDVGGMNILWFVPVDDGMFSPMVQLPSCPVCEKRIDLSLVVTPKFNVNFPEKPVVDVLCKDCWEKVIYDGGVLILPVEKTEAGNKPVKPPVLLVIPEKQMSNIFYNYVPNKKHIVLMPVKEYNLLANHLGAKDAVIREDWKMVPLKNILSEQEGEKALEFLKADNPKGLREYFRTLDLEKKGFNPDFLAYSLIAQTAKMSGEREISDVAAPFDELIKDLESGKVSNDELMVIGEQTGIKIPPSEGRKRLIKGLKALKEDIEKQRKLRHEHAWEEVRADVISRGFFDNSDLREFVLFKTPGSDKITAGITDHRDFFIKDLMKEFDTLEEAKKYIESLGGKT